MKSFLALVVLFGLAIAAVTMVFFGGDKIMSMQNRFTKAGTGLPPLDGQFSGRFETATFALG